MSLAVGNGAAKKQEETRASSFYVDTELYGYSSHLTNDYGERMPEADL